MISVAVCTYCRPEGLAKLLGKLRDLDPASPSYEVVVVDNDAGGSARETVEPFSQSGLGVRYFREPRQNIALARNMSIYNATGRYIAFIDDDEWPEREWLIRLLQVQSGTGAAGVIGPVQTVLPENSARWVTEGRFFRRKTLPTGQPLNWWQTSTSNALVLRNVFDSIGYFSESFGLTGGEDCELFSRAIRKGYLFVQSDTGTVYEEYPASRARFTWLFKRHFRDGMIAERIDPKNQKLSRLTDASRNVLSACPGGRVKTIGATLAVAVILGEMAAAAGWKYRPYRNGDR